MFERARVDGCAAVQIFTKNSNMWKEPTLASELVHAFHEKHAALGSLPILSHTSYLINLGTDKTDILQRSRDALVSEVMRCSELGIAYCVLHPGAHLGAGEDVGLLRVVESLREVCERTALAKTKILIENTAGQGTCVGHRFEHIAHLFEHLPEADARLGVCFDTQHAFASGYDLSTERGYEDTFAEFDKTVGLSRLCAFHLNDSKKPLGSRVDRHEHVGEGNLGAPLFWRLVNDPRFETIPGVLETEPREGDAPYREEVGLLRSWVGKPAPSAPAPTFRLEMPDEAPTRKRKR